MKLVLLRVLRVSVIPIRIPNSGTAREKCITNYSINITRNDLSVTYTASASAKHSYII